MKKNRKRRDPKPKIKIKEAYPYSLTHMLKLLDISPLAAKRFVQIHPPHYTKGSVRRYKTIPEAAARYKIIKKAVGYGIAGIFQEPSSPAVFEGTHDDCKKVLSAVIKDWWSLPRGREVVTAAQQVLSLKELQK